MCQNSFSINAIKIFKQSIDKYHLINSIDQPLKIPYPVNSINYLLTYIKMLKLKIRQQLILKAQPGL